MHCTDQGLVTALSSSQRADREAGEAGLQCWESTPDKSEGGDGQVNTCLTGTRCSTEEEWPDVPSMSQELAAASQLLSCRSAQPPNSRVTQGLGESQGLDLGLHFSSFTDSPENLNQSLGSKLSAIC